MAGEAMEIRLKTYCAGCGAHIVRGTPGVILPISYDPRVEGGAKQTVCICPGCVERIGENPSVVFTEGDGWSLHRTAFILPDPNDPEMRAALEHARGEILARLDPVGWIVTRGYR